MKKLFIKSLMTVGVAGLVGLTSVAMAQAEFNWSGSIRAGYTSVDSGVAGADTIGLIGENNGSRINLNASTDLGNGQAAGAELSYNVGSALTTRRQNVWLNGGWGKLTLGQHGGIYRSAANWDQSSYVGGNVRFDTDAGGDTGLIYASNLDGPFSFDIEIASGAKVTAVAAVEVGDTSTSPVVIVVPEGAGTTTIIGTETVTAVKAADAVPGYKSEVIGRWAATAHYDFGVATLNLGYHNNDRAYNNTAISVNGSAGGFGYYVAYETSKHNVGNKDAKTVGLFLSYDAGDNRIYLEHENGKVDNEANDPKATLLGYRRDLGAGVDFTAEYVTVEPKGKTDKKKVLHLVLKYDF